MPTHQVQLRIGHAIEIGNVDIELPVKLDGRPLGRVKISRGGVDWLPSPNSKRGHRLRWSDFADVMERHGKPTR